MSCPQTSEHIQHLTRSLEEKKEMDTSIIILVVAFLALREANCTSFTHHDLLNSLLKTSKVDFKRNTPTNQLRCINDRAAAEFQQSSQCMGIADSQADTDFTNAASYQATFNAAYEIFCRPGCGDRLVEIYRQCGLFDQYPSAYDLLIGMCATNSNGDRCYEHFFEYISHISTDSQCLSGSQQTQWCTTTCRNSLSSAVDDIGCCINVYQDYYSSFSSSLDYSRAYTACGVSFPGDCGNSPIASSSATSLGLSAGLMTALGVCAVSGNIVA